MLFNSIDFAVFLPIVFILYWFVTNRSLAIQNLLIVVASYVFYGWWDWRFLLLIVISTLTDYYVGIRLSKQSIQSKRKVLLLISILLNLGMLGFFKYYNFFIENFVAAFSFFGNPIQPNTLNIILPVGISFYTFQTLSYTIDVYRRKIEPTRDFIAFTAFVSFFPQLVAGPIEKASSLLPQFYVKRKFEYHKAVDGMRQILWGLFKKVVIADSCAEFTNLIFSNSDSYSGSTLVLGVFFFAFQVYGDFSGYSDIAIGTARLFGFNLMKNFAFPYFSRDISEFWRRWHISLMAWFRDYVYIPLGGSKGPKWLKYRNVFLVFTISGLWHGSDWNYILWGVINGVYLMILMLLNKSRQNMDIVAKGKLLPSLKDVFNITLTFLLTNLAYIIFRAESVSHAFSYIGEIFSLSLFTIPSFQGIGRTIPIWSLVFFLMVFEWFRREHEFALADIGVTWNRAGRWSFYIFIVFLIGMFMQTDETPFIYFQF